MAEQISDIDIYNSSMQKSVNDKLFFIRKADDYDYAVDFGCADGELLRRMHAIKPNLKLIGYDNNSDMVEIASRRMPFIEFTDSLDEVKKMIRGKDALLNLSSVIHEVYSYSDESEIPSFWKFVFGSGFKYVAIRDMMYSNSALKPSPEEDVDRIENWAKENDRMWQLDDYADIWHSDLSDYKDMMHFILKYRYVENWEREVRENYFPISYEKLKSIVSSCGYSIKFENRYILPFIFKKTQEDFGITLEEDTHVKILLKN